MKAPPILPLLLIAACVAIPATADEKSASLHATVELHDGSRILGKPLQPHIRVQSSFGEIELVLERIKELDCQQDPGKARIQFNNGDRLTGTPPDSPFALTTCLGELQIPWKLVKSMRFSMKGGPTMPAGDGPLSLGGIQWTPMRIEAELRDDRIVTLPKVREGFHYGHSGHGRGATLISNVGNPDWQDYRFEFDAVITGIDPKFNPHGVRNDMVGFSTYFRVADLKESWNEKGHSSYSLSISAKGKWKVGAVYGSHCPNKQGFKNSVNDGHRILAEGEIAKWQINQAKRIAIEVVGKRIRVWVDGEALADIEDEEMNKEFGGITLDHGGIGVRWGWEGMGSISNLKVERR